MSKQNLIILVIVLVIIAALILWFTVFSAKEEAAPEDTTAVEPPAAEAPDTLGGEIFEEAKNPLKGEIQTPNPAAGTNPLEGAYPNPFGG